MGGLGSSIALIPVLSFLGINFDMAKAAGLFVNSITTSTASFMNFKRKVLDFKFTIPFVVMSVLFAPIGTYSIRWINIHMIKIFFICFLFLSIYMMLSPKNKPITPNKITLGNWVMYPLGVVVGFMSGLLGIGGGAIIIPTLSFMGFDSKKIAVITSFMIPFSTLAAFVSYIFIVKLDWRIIAITGVAAIMGGYLGNYIMHFKMDIKKTRYFLALLLTIIAFKMLREVLL